MQYLLQQDIASFIPVHPLPLGLALPSPLKPDGHVQVKLPGGVFTQVAPVTQTAVSMVHSSMSIIENNNHLTILLATSYSNIPSHVKFPGVLTHA